MKYQLDAKAMLIMTVLCMIFGSQQIAIKFALEGISPVMQAGLRSIGATVLLCLWMRYKKEAILKRDPSFYWGIIAGLLFSGEFWGLYQSLEYTDATRATVFLYTSPFVVAIGAHFFIKGERLRMIQVMGLALAFIGICVAFSSAFNSKSTLYGDILALLGALFWGATTVVVKASPQKDLSASRVLLYQLGVSAVCLPVISMILGEPGIVSLNTKVMSSIIFQTLVTAFIGYLAWFWLLRQYPAARIASFSFLTPLFGVLFASLFLGEQITIRIIFALCLVGVGIYLVNKPKSDAVNKLRDIGS